MIRTQIRLGQEKNGKMYWLYVVAGHCDGRDYLPETYIPTGRSGRATKFKSVAAAKDALKRAHERMEFYQDTPLIDEPDHNVLSFGIDDWRLFLVKIEETWEELHE